MSVRADLSDEAGGTDSPWYWEIPAVAQLRTTGLDLSPGVTALVGENGAGKSTVVEAVAAAWAARMVGAVAHWGPAGSIEDSDLARRLELDGEWPRPTGGCFLRAEAMHQHFAAVDTGEVELRAFDGLPLNARSHGESFLAFVESRLTERGLWILDEPEAALSFRSCLRLLALFDALREHGSQVLLATHSPVLSALPGTRVLELDEGGIHEREWAELDLVRDWRDFLAAPERWLRHLVGPESGSGEY